MMKHKGWSKALSAVIVVVAVLFVVDRLIAEDVVLLIRASGLEVGGVIVAGSILYGLAGILLAWGWSVLMAPAKGSEIRFVRWLVIYGRSQLAKYVPGNVFHLVGRHQLGRDSGATHGSLVVGSLLEGIGLVFSASAILILGVVWINVEWQPWSGLSLLVLVFVVIWLYRRRQWLVSKLAETTLASQADDALSTTVVPRLAQSIPAYLLFFVISAVIVAGLCEVISPLAHFATWKTVIVVSSAWLAGFLTVGAPAGFGSREAVLVAGLGLLSPEVDGATVAVSYRAVTLLGDIFFFGLSFVVARR